MNSDEFSIEATDNILDQKKGVAMIRPLKYLMFLLAGVSLLAITACSNKVSDSSLLTGNPADPGYREASEVIGESSENSLDAIGEGLDAAFDYLFPPPLAAQATTDTVIYSYDTTTGWHHLIIDYVNDTTGDSYHLDDSVQFKNGVGIPQQYPDTLDLSSIEVKVKRYIHINKYDPYEDFQFRGEDTVLAGVILEVNDTTSVTFNGSSQERAHGWFMHPDSAVECSVEAALNHAVNNLVIPLSGVDCITSGQLAASGNLDIVCPFSTDTLTVSGSWSLIVNIGATIVTFIVQNNTTRWIKVIPKSEFCSGGPVIAHGIIPGRFQ